MNILIVDDCPSNLKLLRAVLEGEGLTVCEAADGREALGVLVRGRVDAIISDILMPRMDGYRFCMEVRANDQFCDLPFIAYSATYTSDRDEKLMTDIGADCFLRKPASAATLAATVEDIVQSKRRRPPTPPRVRPETDLLNEYSERLVAKLEKRNVAREAKSGPLVPVEQEMSGRFAPLQRCFYQNPAMIYGWKWVNKKIVPSIVSKAMSQLLGFTVVESMSYDWWLRQLHPDDRAAAVANIFETAAEGTGCIEYRLRHRDGSIRWVQDQRRSIPDAAGNPLEFTGVWTDITARKQADEAGREQRKQWLAFLATSTAAVFMVRDDRIELANAAAAQITAAASPEELIGRRISDFLTGDSCTNAPACDARLLNGPLPPRAQQLKRPDGRSVEVEASAWHFEFDGRTTVVLEVRDTHQRLRKQTHLALPSAVTAVLAEKGSIAEINRKILATLGAGLESDLGELWMIDRSTQVLRCTDTWHVPSNELGELAIPSERFEFASGEGLPGRVWASGRAESCSHGGNPVDVREQIGFPIKLRQEVVGVISFFCRAEMPLDADLLACFDTIGIQLGQFIERQQLADQLRQAQKMEAIGTLAGGIAHDFNNILGAIFGYCGLARLEAGDNTAIAGYLDAVMGGARRATDLVGQILAFSRQQDQERKPIQLGEVAAETMRLLRAAVPATIEFHVTLDEDAPVVLANATQVHQILMNLGTNAAYAMRVSGGRLTVKLENFVVSAERASAQPDLRVGRYARLTVTDTGHGMDPETLARIYEPMFTTKPCGEGTGFGLTVVRGIVKLHEGAIAASSRRGSGTTFEVYLPAHLAAAPEAEGTSSNMPRGAGERILFVDDEAALANVGKLVLDHLGYVADICANAQQAIAIVTAVPGTYKLVITDQMMPGMTGADLAQRLHTICPDLPLILTSGCTATLVPERLQEIGVRLLLTKPLSVQAIAVAVNQVLTDATAGSMRIPS